MSKMYYDQIIHYNNLALINRHLANEKLSFSFGGMRIEIMWLSFNMSQPSEQDVKEPMMHRHTFFETHLCLQGSISYQANGDTLTIHPGEALIFSRDVEHAGVVSSRDIRKIALAFDIQWDDPKTAFSLVQMLSEHRAVVISDMEEVLPLFLNILEEADAQKPFFQVSIQALLMRIILIYARRVSQNSYDPPQDRSNTADSRVTEINDYIRAHMNELVTVSDLAQHLHLSTKQINRILQREFLLSGREYVERIKCEYTKSLLLHTDMSLNAIANEIGYTNVFSFNKFFRRVEGMPPGLFRKSHYSF